MVWKFVVRAGLTAGAFGAMALPVWAQTAPVVPAVAGNAPIMSFSSVAKVLKAQDAAAPAAAEQDPQQPVSSPMPAGGGRVFNPDMSVIANFVGIAGKNEIQPTPLFNLSEVEMSFQAVVDPYARADFFLSATPEGLEVEEGYITFTTLPAGLQLKAGKMRAQFGKVNTQHTHALPYSDRPIVTNNLVGGEDGISDAGVSLSKLFATRALFLEATGELYAGNNGVYQNDARSKLNVVGRVRGYRDLTEGTNIDFGFSTSTGPTTSIGEDAKRTLYGVDATFRYRPLRRAIYRRLQARTEMVWSRQDGALPTDPRQAAFGWYALGEYQFAQRWYSGVRFDRSERAIDASMIDTGQSFFITFWPSEFSQIRGQFRRTSYAEGSVANEVLFQFNFSIGAHGAHVF